MGLPRVVSPNAESHRSRPWRVHELASDFRLLDLWEFPIRAEVQTESFEDFYRVFRDDATRVDRLPVYSLWPRSLKDLVHLFLMGALGSLLGVRLLLGRVFGWDRADRTLEIPGAAQSSVRDRMTDADRERNRVESSDAGPFDFHTVYAFEREALHEVSNATIHALLHLSWVESEDGRGDIWMAIYTASRGWQSDAYMALIKPFRYAFVYPAWIEHVVRTWQCRRPNRSERR